MKRMSALWLALSLTSPVLASPALAQDAISDHLGMVGLGYFISEAPLGLRYWASPTLGIDLGLGFKSENQVPIVEESGTKTTSLTDFAVEGGLLLAISSHDNMILFVRPGIAFLSEQEVIKNEEQPGYDPDPAVPGNQKASATTFSLTAMLGAELFLTKFGFSNLSLGGGYGIALASRDPAEAGDSTTTVGSFLAEVSVVSSTSVGFHFYF